MQVLFFEVLLGDRLVLFDPIRNGIGVAEEADPGGPVVLPVVIDLATGQGSPRGIGPAQVDLVDDRRSGVLQCQLGDVAEDQLLVEVLGTDGDLRTFRDSPPAPPPSEAPSLAPSATSSEPASPEPEPSDSSPCPQPVADKASTAITASISCQRCCIVHPLSGPGIPRVL